MAWDMRVPLGSLDYNGNLSCAMQAPIVDTGSPPVCAAARNDPVPPPGQAGEAPGREVEGSVPMERRTRTALAEGALGALLYLGFALIGLVLTLRLPANPIGWLCAASGLVWSLGVPGEAWASWLVATGRPLPLAAKIHLAVGEPLWAPAIALGVTLPLLLFPDGRLRSPRWRLAVAASVAGGVLSMAAAFEPGPLVSTPVDNPLGLAGAPGEVAAALAALGGLLHVGSLAAALVCMALRFRSSRGTERQQLRWVAAGAAGAVLGLLAVVGLLTLQDHGILPGAWVVTLALALPCVPVSVTVAVLRYRLWDLDRLISRTVTYLLVTGLALIAVRTVRRRNEVKR